jgi:hypothetical protein
MTEHEFPPIERVRPVLPPGTYRLVLASVEEKVSTVSHKRYAFCVFVAVEPIASVVYGYLAFPEDAPHASWIWEDVVEHPRDLEAGMVLYADIRSDTYQNQVRNRLGKLRAGG